MSKKILVVAALLTVVSVSGAFGWGIGIQGGWNKGIPGNIALTLKFDPWAFAGNFYIAPHRTAFGLTADYWFLNDNIAGPLNWFIGAGLGGTISIWENGYSYKHPHKNEYYTNNVSFGMSARLPIGLNMMLPVGPVELEPYLQVVPALWLNFVPYFAPDFDIDLNLGLRVHL